MKKSELPRSERLSEPIRKPIRNNLVRKMLYVLHTYMNLASAILFRISVLNREIIRWVPECIDIVSIVLNKF